MRRNKAGECKQASFIAADSEGKAVPEGKEKPCDSRTRQHLRPATGASEERSQPPVSAAAADPRWRTSGGVEAGATDHGPGSRVPEQEEQFSPDIPVGT